MFKGKDSTRGSGGTRLRGIKERQTMTVKQLWTRAEAEKSAHLAFDAAADLFTDIMDRLPDAAFKAIDRETLMEREHALVTINLATGRLSVGMAPAGTAVPAELFSVDRNRPAAQEDGAVVPFKPKQ
jgi:hypothetical protein